MTSDMGPDVTPNEAAAEATHPAVFISHARDDHAVAEQICRLLEENGIGCWIAPRNVDAGRDYADQILDGIESTRVMVLLLSGPANDSIFVKREVERAISKGKVVIPFRIQEVQPSRSLELFISNHQWIDALVPPLDSRVYVLAAAIRGLLRLPPLHGDEDRAAAVAEVPNLPRPEQLPPQQPLYGTPQPQLPPRQPLYGAPQQPPVPPQSQAYAQPAPQPQAAPTVCPRCRAPLYPGYTMCGNCGFDSAQPAWGAAPTYAQAAWGSAAPAVKPAGSKMPILLALGAIVLLAVAGGLVLAGTNKGDSAAASPSASTVALASPTSTPTPTSTPRATRTAVASSAATAEPTLADATPEPSPLSAWTSYAAPDKAWSVKFPSATVPMKQSLPLNSGLAKGDMTMYTVVDSSGGVYAVAYFDFPAGTIPTSTSSLLKTMEATMATGTGGTLVTSNDATLGGRPAAATTSIRAKSGRMSSDCKLTCGPSPIDWRLRSCRGS